ncbi:tRNA 2-thiouridine(34) synthase MnmA [Candidatus Saccharibacteria bacterium]|nr:tRNA 2-thiouridine(34) synthase MnmA [Candidatus Saccharibacteria bacterium]
MNEKKLVYVGLSGGVDSSVAAKRLLDAGYRVVGAYMKNWTRDIAGNRCPWEDDLLSAKSVAAHLGIELKVFDLQAEYKQLVVDAMVHAYESGETPNPDILCNQEIKFRIFYNLCREAGADMVATGHYATIKPVVADSQVGEKSIRFRLAQAEDKSKDQTYFLYRMPVMSAEHVLFPLGDSLKSTIRGEAQSAQLPTAQRRESMGLCFVGKIPLKDFLGEFTTLTPGDIINQEGKVIGQHDGALLYTIGQRHGLGVGGGTPYYVVSKDIVANTVTVTTDPTVLRRSHYDITNCHWWADPDLSREYQVRIRHLGELLACSLEKMSDDAYRIHLVGDSHRGVASGQHAVLYDGDLVLGGGVLV